MEGNLASRGLSIELGTDIERLAPTSHIEPWGDGTSKDGC